MKTPHAIVFAALLVAGSAQAESGVPFVGWIAQPAPAEVSIVILPDGSGDPLSSAQLFGGARVDATVTLGLVDYNGLPIANFPFQDMWLASESATAQGCWFSGFPADHNTMASGESNFALPLWGGGWSTGPVWVHVNGTRAEHPQNGELPPVALRFNSPDLNADGSVDMSDLVTFAADFFGPYRYRSDFVWDGVINLTDVVVMANALGKRCP